jgi:hypothetical protein
MLPSFGNEGENPVFKQPVEEAEGVVFRRKIQIFFLV